MEFDDLKTLWESQGDAPEYDHDQQRLHNRVVTHHQKIRFMAELVEKSLIVISASLVMFALYSAFHDAKPHHWVTAVLFTGVAGYMLWDRQRRKRFEGQSDGTVLSDLDCAIRSLEHQINRQSRFIFWFLAPASAILLTRMTSDFSDKPLWFWLAVPLIFVVIAIAVRWEIRNKLVPRLEDLRDLRKLLVEESD